METIPALRKQATLLAPSVRIGKNGLTPSVISEIDTLLSKRGLVKIKMLRASLGSDRDEDDDPDASSSSVPLPSFSKEDLAKEAAQKTRSALVQQVGLVFTLYREPKKKETRTVVTKRI